MTSRDRIVLLVVAAAIAVGGFWMLALKPKRDEAAALGQQLTAAQQRLTNAESDLAASRAAQASYSANYATVARLGKAVPTDDDVPSLVYQLDSTAQATGVDFRSVKLTSGSGSGAPAASQPGASGSSAGSSAAGSSAGSSAAGSSTGSSAAGSGAGGSGAGSSAAGSAPGGSGASSGSTSTASASNSSSSSAAAGTPSAPAPPTQAATAALPPGAVVGPAGLNTMPFSFTFQGSFFRLSDFLSRIERYIAPSQRGVDVRGRLLLVNGISLTAAQSGFPQMKAAISATAYLLPANQGLFNGATPNVPPAGSNQAVSAPSSGSPTPAAPATVTAP